MPEIATGLTIGATLLGARSQSKAVSQAADAQSAAALAGIDLQREQFDKMQELLKPWIDKGMQGVQGMEAYAAPGLKAMQGQLDLIGQNGAEAQQAAIAGLENSPLFQGLARQGEQAMLQRAAATGGLRGGNIQGALAQYRPALLQQEIGNQYNRLGGFAGQGLAINQNLATMGQASAAGVGAAGMQSAANQANLYGQMGAAQAGSALGQARAMQQVYNLPATLRGMGVDFGGMFGGFRGSNMPDHIGNADASGNY